MATVGRPRRNVKQNKNPEFSCNTPKPSKSGKGKSSKKKKEEKQAELKTNVEELYSDFGNHEYGKFDPANGNHICDVQFYTTRLKKWQKVILDDLQDKCGAKLCSEPELVDENEFPQIRVKTDSSSKCYKM